MKSTKIGIIALAALLLTGCGKKIGTESSSAETTTSAAKTTSSAATTAAATTTTAATTTAKTISKDPPSSVILDSAESVEVYSEMTVAELITDNNVRLTSPADLIDTDGLGEKKTTVRFEYEGSEYEKEVAYTVVDTTPPLILNSGWNPYAKVGEPFNIDSIIGYVDNYDRAPSVTYAGNVDTSAVGSFPLAVTVTDSSGNSTDFDLTVLVLNEIPQPTDDNERVAYSDFISRYDSGDVSFGIDVSAWQTDVDYNAVKEAGCEFVLMRMGYYYRDAPVMDDYYRQNMENATAAGLDVGVYFYSADNTEEGAREHARWIVEQLGGRKLDYPVAFDWEEWGSFQEYGMNIHDLNCIFEAFCDELGKNGYSAMLYSSKNFLNNFWENRGDHPVWLAHYVDETDYEGKYAIWQASAYGRIPGIAGDVDMNIRYNSEPLE